MNVRIFFIFLIVFTNAQTAFAVQVNQSETLDAAFKTKVQPFVETYCSDCHFGNGAEGDTQLDLFSSTTDVGADLETWANVLDEMQQGSMPPDDAEQPTTTESEFVQNWILKTIDQHRDKVPPLGMVRRMTRFEYENTIRDLFRLERDCFTNPARIIRTSQYFDPSKDKMPNHVLAVSYFANAEYRFSDLEGVSTLSVDPPVEHGFANDQETLSLAPVQMENYFSIANGLLESQEFPGICGEWNSMFASQANEDAEASKKRANEVLTAFLPRAFRSPVSDGELQRYKDLFNREFDSTSSYTQAMKSTIVAVLVSPRFLFRTEFYQPPLESDLDDSKAADGRDLNFALASRLSFFLWGSMPDDELLAKAAEGTLTDTNVLQEQFERMMRDDKIKSLSIDFGMQWLKLQKVASALPDPDKYPDYYVKAYPPPAASMMIEQMLFFETIMVENRSILEFVKSDFAYLNRQLITWYQMDVEKTLGYVPPLENFEDFFRIQWPSEHRGGVITSGAMLLSTSTTRRTSPVYRGAWVLDVVFNSPPPPAPADVPPLEPAEDKQNLKLNVRDKLEKHRLDPACSSCHDRIDPLGFGLEIFDTVGRWRKVYENGEPVDASGDIDGDAFDGPVRLKNVILRKKERFVQAFVEHVVKYALGRQLHFSDEPEIQRITEKVLKDDCRFHSVIREVVKSDLFRR